MELLTGVPVDDALTWLRQGPMDAAFLNLEMPGMNGLALARMIQKIQPRCNLIVAALVYFCLSVLQSLYETL